MIWVAMIALNASSHWVDGEKMKLLFFSLLAVVHLQLVWKEFCLDLKLMLMAQ